MRGSNFSFLVKQGVRGAWHNKTMTFASFCILTVSLLLVGFTLLVSLNIRIIVGNIEDKHEIAVYLMQDSTDEDVANVEKSLKLNSNVEQVIFVNKEEAVAEMKAALGESYEALFDGVEDDFLPFSFRVRVNDINKIGQVTNTIKSINKVDVVKAPADFARVLNGIDSTLTVIGLAVVAALTVVCIVIISNTTRASVFTRRREINIMKFVGATNTFIRIPFFVEGMFVGALSAIAAWGVTWFGYESLFKLFSEDPTMWLGLGVTNLITFDTIKWFILGCYLVAGTFLGALGTIISVKKHLKV